MSEQVGASVESGRSFISGGKWAGERFMEAMQRSGTISPSDLRTAATLLRDEWIHFDRAIVEEAQIRLRGVSALIGAGLVQTIPNGLARTILIYDKMTDMGDAVVSLDGLSKAENDTVEFEDDGIPLPITHKDWYLNLRRLMASRAGGVTGARMPLDTAHARAASRKVAEETERMLFQGGKRFGAYTIYGLTNHPDRNTVSFGDGGTPWGDSSKTGSEIVADVGTLMLASEADRYYGPWWIFVGANVSAKLGEDFKANSDRTILERVLAIEGIQRLIVCDQMPADEVVMIQASSDVVQMVSGEPLQNIQWDIEGGMQVNFKAFQIMVPLIRSDAQGRSGIVHMT